MDSVLLPAEEWLIRECPEICEEVLTMFYRFRGLGIWSLRFETGSELSVKEFRSEGSRG